MESLQLELADGHEDGLILAFDTSGPHCAACLLSDGMVRVTLSEHMARGQAERLVPLLETVLAVGGVGWSDLVRVAVGIGPGNFTGIRIGVSTARGLALGLGIPAIGVSLFEVIRAGPMEDLGHGCRATLAAVPGPRGLFYLEEEGRAPFIEGFADPPACAFPPEDPAEIVQSIARIAAWKTPGPRPAPLYIRPADAAPASDPPPVILP